MIKSSRHPEFNSGSHVVANCVNRLVGKMLNQVQHDIGGHFVPRRPTENPRVQDDNCVNALSPRKIAFTMAEILLSLTIIGVVAAITLPSLTGNINERTWNTQRQAFYSRISQAISLMPNLNGYGISGGVASSQVINGAAETFLTAGLSKVLKINNICDADHLGDCGLANNYKIGQKGSWNGNTYVQAYMDRSLDSIKTLYDYNSMVKGQSWADSGRDMTPNTAAAAFETANGESVLVYYNPLCKPYMNELDYDASVWAEMEDFPRKMCVNFVFDMNGKKGPNTMAKDVGFLTVFYPSDPVVVMPKFGSMLENSYSWEGTQKCKAINENFRLPNPEEMMSLAINNSFNTNYYAGWTSKKMKNGVVALFFNGGTLDLTVYGEQSMPAVCVER